MGAYDNGNNKTRERKSKATQADEQRTNRRRNRGNGDVADWGNVQPDLVINAITAVTSHGFAIRFGYTRDGGAFAIGIVGDGEPFTEYCRPNEDVDLWLTGIALDYAKT